MIEEGGIGVRNLQQVQIFREGRRGGVKSCLLLRCSRCSVPLAEQRFEYRRSHQVKCFLEPGEGEAKFGTHRRIECIWSIFKYPLRNLARSLLVNKFKSFESPFEITRVNVL